MILPFLCLLLLAGPSWGFDRIAHEAIGHIAESRLRSTTLEQIREIVGPGQTLASVSSWADGHTLFTHTGWREIDGIFLTDKTCAFPPQFLALGFSVLYELAQAFSSPALQDSTGKARP